MTIAQHCMSSCTVFSTTESVGFSLILSVFISGQELFVAQTGSNTIDLNYDKLESR